MNTPSVQPQLVQSAPPVPSSSPASLQQKPAPLTTPNLDLRINLVQRTLDNTQMLVRAMETKAAFTLTATGVLSASIFGIIQALRTPTFNEGLVIAVCIVVYVVMASMTMLSASRVYIASGTTLNPNPNTAGLLFPLMILQRYNDDFDAYHKQWTSISTNELLRDYAHQVLEVSNIYRAKQRNVNRTLRLFRVLCLCWIVVATVGILIHIKLL